MGSAQSSDAGATADPPRRRLKLPGIPKLRRSPPKTPPKTPPVNAVAADPGDEPASPFAWGARPPPGVAAGVPVSRNPFDDLRVQKTGRVAVARAVWEEVARFPQANARVFHMNKLMHATNTWIEMSSAPRM